MMTLVATSVLLVNLTPALFPQATSDSAAIQAAVDLGAARGEPVTIPAWNERTQTNVWILAETILLPSGSTVYLDNCRLRMADGVFCNAFANKNAWAEGRNKPSSEEHDIQLIGLGHAVLDGGTFNGWGERSAPDVGDLREPGQNAARRPKRLQHNCPIFFHNVRHFTVRGLHIYHQRYWGMCYSFCSEGEIRDIRIESDLSWMSDDGKVRDPNRQPTPYEYKNVLVKNGDGIDIRRGCHDILIENISGFTEDDTIALTNVPGKKKVHADDVEGLSPDIHHVTIRNVRAEAWCSMNVIRLLVTDEGRVHDVAIDGIFETHPPCMKGWRAGTAVQINDARAEYTSRRSPTTGSMCNISIRNVFAHAGTAIRLAETIENLSVENVHVTDGASAILSVNEHARFVNCSVRGLHATPKARLTAVFDFHETSGALDVSDVFVDTAEHLVRLSGGDVNVRIRNEHLRNLRADRILRIAKGAPSYGGHIFAHEIPSYAAEN